VTGDDLRQLEPKALLELLQRQVNMGLMIVKMDNLIDIPPDLDSKGKPLLRIGDFTIFARHEVP